MVDKPGADGKLDPGTGEEAADGAVTSEFPAKVTRV